MAPTILSLCASTKKGKKKLEMKKPGGPKPTGFVWSMFDNSLEIYVQAARECPDRVNALRGIYTARGVPFKRKHHRVHRAMR